MVPGLFWTCPTPCRQHRYILKVDLPRSMVKADGDANGDKLSSRCCGQDMDHDATQILKDVNASNEIIGRFKGSNSMEDFYRDLYRWLPERIEIATANYRKFTAADPPEDTKAFAAHESACRASLAHIYLLMRLARWGESTSDPSNADSKSNLDQMFGEAQIAIKNQLLDDT